MKHEPLTFCLDCLRTPPRCEACTKAWILSKAVAPSWRDSRWLQGIQDTSDGEIYVGDGDDPRRKPE